MQCDFCGEEIEGSPFYKDGMCFCSLECSDAMEEGETMPLDEDILNDPDDDDEEERDGEKDRRREGYADDEFDEDMFDVDERPY